MHLLGRTAKYNRTWTNHSEGVGGYNPVASDDGDIENAPRAPRLAFNKSASWNWRPFLLAASISSHVLLILLLAWLWPFEALFSAFSESCHLPTDELWGRPSRHYPSLRGKKIFFQRRRTTQLTFPNSSLAGSRFRERSRVYRLGSF
jgi:hypothetical protein